MRVVYEPRGMAREYAELAVNLYAGCGHGCDYCYAPGVLRMSREEFGRPRPRDGILGLVERDARYMRLRGEGRAVLLCFTCDPYQPLDVELGLTRAAMDVLVTFGQRVTVLTKGGLRATRDFDLLKRCGGEFGTTLTFLDPARSAEREPGAAAPAERLEALERAHALGIGTWVSLEPVIDPAESMALIRESCGVVDRYMIGRLNHRRGGIDMGGFLAEALGFLRAEGKRVYVKRATRRYCKGLGAEEE